MVTTTNHIYANDNCEREAVVVFARHVVKRLSKSSSLGYIYIYINCLLIYTSAHTLARSLHDVSCANNNLFAVVVCFRLTFHSWGMRIFF